MAWSHRPVLKPATPTPGWSLWCLTKCYWQTCQHCLSCIFTYISCIKLLLLHQAVIRPRRMLKLQELLGTWPCTPSVCETLWSPRYYPESATAVRFTQQLISITVFLTSQKLLLHCLPLWLSRNILYVLWVVQNAASRMITLPAQAWWVILAQRGMHGLPLKHNILI